MTCKDCYHNDVCSKKDGTTNFYGKEYACNDVEKRCQNFKDKSRIVELPCDVGDKIYCDGKYFADDCEGKVMKFIVGDVKTNVYTYHRGEIDMIFRFSDFGKKVFLTREEAEKSIKELEK